jgi:N-acetylmuramoyl-L-alanine amidase
VIKMEFRDKTVVIDAGHGGRDTGAVWGDVVEKDIALYTAKRLQEALSPLFGKVLLTRGTDMTLAIAGRDSYARRVGADFFISVHYNAGGNDNTRGGEVWLNQKAWGVYDFRWLTNRYKDMGSYWRGLKKAENWYGRVMWIARRGYYVYSIPSMLWEVEFVQRVAHEGWWKNGKITEKGYSELGMLVGSFAMEFGNFVKEYLTKHK